MFHAALKLTQQFLMPLHYGLQLSREQHASFSGRGYLLHCWQVAIEEDIKMTEVLAFCVHELTNHLVSVLLNHRCFCYCACACVAYVANYV